MLSIHMRPKKEEAQAVEPAPEAVAERPMLETPFEQKDLYRQWYRFTTTLPREQTAMATRMRGMEPVLGEGWSVEVPVENQQVIIYMEALKAQLQAFLRRELKNDRLTIGFRLPAENERRRIYNKKELYAAMLEKSTPSSSWPKR